MGTKADFYVGTGPSAEWIGSISYDGHPECAPANALGASSEVAFRAEVERLLSEPPADRVPTRPAEGWPWPWPDSRTTDYAYAWCPDGVVRISAGGRRWVTQGELDSLLDDRGAPEMLDSEVCDMTARRADDAVILSKSGINFLVTAR